MPVDTTGQVITVGNVIQGLNGTRLRVKEIHPFTGGLYRADVEYVSGPVFRLDYVELGKRRQDSGWTIVPWK